uniref:Uncharacterized protein n=1 Tax=Romanomermis culicivorax TaxID=13658 RepID=A0A915K4H9_ROMCU
MKEAAVFIVNAYRICDLSTMLDSSSSPYEKSTCFDINWTMTVVGSTSADNFRQFDVNLINEKNEIPLNLCFNNQLKINNTLVDLIVAENDDSESLCKATIYGNSCILRADRTSSRAALRAVGSLVD